MFAHPLTVRTLAFTIMMVTVLANRARAEDFERIRTESSLLSTVMKAALVRSPTLRSLVEQIEQSDVIVYLTCEHFASSALAGRTSLAMVRPGVRYVRVQVVCQQIDSGLIAIVAHELQHVGEIASTASVVDRGSLIHLYSEIGFSTHGLPQSEQFETVAALKTGDRVRWELNHYTDVEPPANAGLVAKAFAAAD